MLKGFRDGMHQRLRTTRCLARGLFGGVLDWTETRRKAKPGATFSAGRTDLQPRQRYNCSHRPQKCSCSSDKRAIGSHKVHVRNHFCFKLRPLDVTEVALNRTQAVPSFTSEFFETDRGGGPFEVVSRGRRPRARISRSNPHLSCHSFQPGCTKDFD